MPEATTIVEVCDAITDALRARGFFEPGKEDSARAAAVDEAVKEASAKLGIELKASERSEDGGCTVLAEGIPGVVTIVSQRRVSHPGAKGEAEESVNPDFGVTWALA